MENKVSSVQLKAAYWTAAIFCLFSKDIYFEKSVVNWINSRGTGINASPESDLLKQRGPRLRVETVEREIHCFIFTNTSICLPFRLVCFSESIRGGNTRKRNERSNGQIGQWWEMWSNWKALRWSMQDCRTLICILTPLAGRGTSSIWGKETRHVSSLPWYPTSYAGNASNAGQNIADLTVNQKPKFRLAHTSKKY